MAHRNVKSFCRSNKKELVALISTYYDVSSMDTPRIYQEDLSYQSKALKIPTFKLHSHSIPDVIIHSQLVWKEPKRPCGLCWEVMMQEVLPNSLSQLKRGNSKLFWSSLSTSTAMCRPRPQGGLVPVNFAGRRGELLTLQWDSEQLLIKLLVKQQSCPALKRCAAILHSTLWWSPVLWWMMFEKRLVKKK